MLKLDMLKILNKNIFLTQLFFLISCASQAQEIIGGSLSPDLKNINPNSLVELVLGNFKNDTPDLHKVSNVDWIVLLPQLDGNAQPTLTNVKGYIDKSNNHLIFVAQPGNYLILCNYSLLDSKNTLISNNHVISNISVKSPPNPNNDIVVPVIPNVPIINGKTYISLISNNTSTPLNSIESSFQTLGSNFIWNRYTPSSTITFNGQQIPISATPYGQAALKIINNQNNSNALVISDQDGKILGSTLISLSDADIVNYVKSFFKIQ
jgi:hypothetical protein